MVDTTSIDTTGAHPVLATVSVGALPWQIAFSPDGTKAYTSPSGSNSTAIIDEASRTVTSIPVGTGPYWTDVASDGAQAFVSLPPQGSVSIIDLATQQVEATVPTGRNAWTVLVVNVPVGD
jgi:YVTN family beta-propeller protein